MYKANRWDMTMTAYEVISLTVVPSGASICVRVMPRSTEDKCHLIVIPQEGKIKQDESESQTNHERPLNIGNTRRVAGGGGGGWGNWGKGI